MNKKRWVHCDETYDERMKIMVRFMQDDKSVLDLGCGLEHLKLYIPGRCTYQGCDIVKRSENSLVCDFNKNEYPQFMKYDYVVCSGLLEYLNDLPTFLENIKKYGKYFIYSYAVKTNTEEEREINDWINHLNEPQLLLLLQNKGYTVINKTYWKNQLILFME